MAKNETLSNFMDSVKEKSMMIKYKAKCKKLNISPEFLSYVIERINMKYSIDILEIIKKSNNIEQFRKNIENYIIQNPSNIYNSVLLIGNLLGKYNIYNILFEKDKINIDHIKNFNLDNKDKVLNILKQNFYDYVMNDNSIKNKFFKNENNIKNLTGEISVDEINQLFDDVVNGNINVDANINNAKIIHEYIFKIVNKYTLDDILNHFDFIQYDMQSKNDENLDEKRKKYKNHRIINSETQIRIDNLELLKDKLKRIKSSSSKNLLSRLNEIDKPYEHLDEINDIYLEYEMLFRDDLINHLFIPTKEETTIEDFRNVKPQLIHCFIRNPEKLIKDLEEKIIDKIIKDRNNNNSSRELSKEEQDRFDKLLNKLELELDQSQVNFFFDSSGISSYTDANGFNRYISDTSNQIAASIYSENFFNNYIHEMIGIGFNQEGLLPEAIALSSPTYLTTNKGLNNLEYDSKNEFSLTSACYDDLIKNDGKSEVVLFRRNLDYDTKASYIFVAFNSENDKEYQKLIDKGRELAKKNHMKLVLYDLKKIRESYKEFIQKNNEMNSEIIEISSIKHR